MHGVNTDIAYWVTTGYISEFYGLTNPGNGREKAAVVANVEVKGSGTGFCGDEVVLEEREVVRCFMVVVMVWCWRKGKWYGVLW